MSARQQPLEPRMLTRAQAAQYSGLGTRFARCCPVRPRRIAPGQQGLRYDRAELDRWLDTLPKDGQDARPSDWLARVGHDPNENPRRKDLRQ
mgnify:CR=1 FL=1